MYTRRNSSILRERVTRHQKLMRLIKNYTRTGEEIKKLERIKNNTMMEINLRYMRSEHNRHYKFPKMDDSDSEEQPNGQFNFLAKREVIVYDLKSQNEMLKGKSVSSKVITLDSSRRVHSLDREHNQWQKERILRLNQKSKHNNSLKKLRKNSLSSTKKLEVTKFRLPELKRERENIKTQTNRNEEEIQSIIGKKLITEISETKNKGVEKYLHKDRPKNSARDKNMQKRKIYLQEIT